ncbi:MAG: hypothetical protein HOV79_32415 [Hamadaea sp.]|nr:hypothetical protein [Hamadaea sp.]
MRLEMAHVLDPPRSTQAWRMYEAAFAPLRTRAMQRHAMNREEFDQVMADKRVEKHLALDPRDDAIVALATFTNVLDAMPLISPEYFATRWPDLYERHRVWYLGFFAIEAEHRHSGIFEAVIGQMWAPIQAGGGVAALDIPMINVERGLADAITRTLRDLTPDMVAEQVDAQTYWAFTRATPRPGPATTVA